MCTLAVGAKGEAGNHAHVKAAPVASCQIIHLIHDTYGKSVHDMCVAYNMVSPREVWLTVS